MKKGIPSTLIGIALIAVFSVLMFFLLKGFWAFATFFAWGFLAIAAVVNYKVIVDYGKRLFDLLKRNPLYGIGGIAFSVLLYPVVFFILMMRALGGKAISSAGFEIPGQVPREREEQFTDYEIIDEELELRELETRKREERQ